MLATLLNTPPWANHHRATNVAPANPADYTWITRWAAGHFAGRVAASREIWNQEDTAAFWDPPDPAAYTALVQAAGPAIKAGDPPATVVLGGTSYNDVTYLAALSAHGIRGSLDAVATHPYEGVTDDPPATADDGYESALTHVAAVHAVIAAHGDGALPISFTELAGRPRPLGRRAGGAVTPAQQGGYLVDAALGRPPRPLRHPRLLVRSHRRDRRRHPGADYGPSPPSSSQTPLTVLRHYLTQSGSADGTQATAVPTVPPNGINMFYSSRGPRSPAVVPRRFGRDLATSAALLVEPFTDGTDARPRPRGLGPASVPPAYTMAQCTADAAALLDHLGWAGCRVVG